MSVLGSLGTGMQVASDASNLAGGLVDLFTRKKRREEQFAREDTAVQRRANDLEAAGLSKTLAAGTAASATPVTQRSTQTKVGTAQAVLANAQKELTNAKINESRTQQDLNEALASKANTEAGNLVLMRPKIGSESTLAADKAVNIPREQKLFEMIGWSYYKDMPGYSGEVARLLSSLWKAGTGLTKTMLAGLQDVVAKLPDFPSWDERSKWIEQQLDKLKIFGRAREGVRTILQNPNTQGVAPGQIMNYDAMQNRREMTPDFMDYGG